MLLYLQEPFKTQWRKGYLQTHPNGRKYVCLYNTGDLALDASSVLQGGVSRK